MNRRGFTLVELLIAIGIAATIILVAIPSVYKLGESHASSPADNITSLLNSSSRRARNGDNASAWGVYLPYDNVSRLANEIIVFSGDSYATRDATHDITYDFDDVASFTTVELSGSAPSTGNDHEAVFSSLTGETSLYGTITIDFREATTVINVSPSGFTTTQ